MASGRDLFLNAFLLEICIAGSARYRDVGVYTVKTIYFPGSFRWDTRLAVKPLSAECALIFKGTQLRL